ncbi:VacJ family lipoprotein [Caenispirillum bisanense]|uniref:Phospholipid-binding lipoprotein MlaA n=1 Tax=Caenispirillum bisanense TaxID=414052 RepID=A0A286GW11_9PROT|nr:VacJ family lipoprotein [Caenispirillum bisanense]SOD99747.1 phospholipid-binding lipoprotein MlaA [Caenispirillum bisanense]
MKTTAKTIVSAVFAMTLTACASTQQAADVQPVDNDPIEPFNRAMFQVHDVLDQAVVYPVAWTYKNVLPNQFQYYIHSFLTNLGAPVVFLNDVLQGNGDRAFNTFMRFTLNSTFGLGGTLDFATEAGFPAHDEDFGQTLAVWGVESGPYIFLPLIGPTNPRDAVGRVVDSFADPFNWAARHNDWEGFMYGRLAAEGIDRRARLIPYYDDLRDSSVDFYATLRSAYGQRRAAEIRNQETGDAQLPNYEFDVPDEPAETPAKPAS